MPNIFERARAYDNWNEGNFQPQEDGYGSISDKYNSYKKVYDQLSEKEKTLSFKHPYLAIEIKKNREKAFRATMHFDGTEDGYGDAIRHCYWCADACRDFATRRQQMDTCCYRREGAQQNEA